MNHLDVHLKLTQHCKSTVLQLKKKKEAIADLKFNWELFYLLNLATLFMRLATPERISEHPTSKKIATYVPQPARFPTLL